MSIESIEQEVIKVIQTIQTISGREFMEINGATVVIGDVVGFDSLNGIEATLELSEKFNHDFAAINLMVDDKNMCPLTVREIAEKIYMEVKN